MPEQPRSLVAKLVAACAAVGGLEKKGNNTAQNYKYLKAPDVAKAMRQELFSRGVLITQDEEDFYEGNTIKTSKGAEIRQYTLKVRFTIWDSDSAETIAGVGYGVAMDSGDKAIYKCKTGALKYFLRGLGLIPDEKDDPEASKPPRPTAERDPDLPTPLEAKEYVEILKGHGKNIPPDVLRSFVLAFTGATSANKVTRKQWSVVLQAMDEAANKGTLEIGRA